MKKFCFAVAMILVFATISGCKTTETVTNQPVELTVVTPFSGSDGNRKNFVEAYKAYEQASGNIVIDVKRPRT